MNKVIIIGRVVKDFELKYTTNNMATCSFTLAVDKGLSREKRQEAEANNRPTADFPRIVVWGKLAENASAYLSKGSKCAIEGRIQTGSYQDRETGKTVYTTDVVADKVEFLDSQNRTQNNAGATERDNRGITPVMAEIIIEGKIRTISLMMISKRCKMTEGFHSRRIYEFSC